MKHIKRNNFNGSISNEQYFLSKYNYSMQKQQMNCDYNSFPNEVFNLSTNRAMNVYQNNNSASSYKEYNHKFMFGANDIMKPSFSFLSDNGTNYWNSTDKKSDLAQVYHQNDQTVNKSKRSEQLPSKVPNLSKLDTNVAKKLATSGNMFHYRYDWSILKQVPIHKQNTFNIVLEEDGSHGKEETKLFLLQHFSTLSIREIGCVLCGCHLSIYDRFPLIDGTFYVSPVNYDIPNQLLDNTDIPCSVPAIVANKNQFIYAICLGCLHSSNNNNIKCKSCKQVWVGGSTLQIGTMYRYEIFAAFPCCQKRFNCSKCDTPIINLNKTGGLQFFSSYSDEVTCQMCKTKDYHFIKPLSKFYDITINQK